jgi:diguanylate cyclase (GGDEF)-like protein
MDRKILIADDNAKNVRLLKDILEDEGYMVFTEDNGLSVLDIAHQIMPDAILLDIMMPGKDGFDVCRELKEDFDTKDIPIIMVTAKIDGKDLKKAFELGAFDYIKKPIDEVEVVARVQSALRQKLQMDKLKELASKDGLTGVYNHSLLMELFEKEYYKQERNGGSISFVMLDIDFFKKVNDTYGHTYGDVILQKLAAILTDSVRSSDIVGRYGGEEFSIVIPEFTLETVYRICERIRSTVEAYEFVVGKETIRITISIGICFKLANDQIDSMDMVKMADEALYRAKQNGRNRIEN